MSYDITILLFSKYVFGLTIIYKHLFKFRKCLCNYNQADYFLQKHILIKKRIIYNHEKEHKMIGIKIGIQIENL